jgi:hypothetical protein
MASADPCNDPRRCSLRFLGPLHGLAESEVQRWMSFRYAPAVANPPRVQTHLAHVAAVALQHAGAMQYRATLSESRQQSYRPHRRAFLEAAEGAAASLADAVERHLCQGQWQRQGRQRSELETQNSELNSEFRTAGTHRLRREIPGRSARLIRLHAPGSAARSRAGRARTSSGGRRAGVRSGCRVPRAG